MARGRFLKFLKRLCVCLGLLVLAALVVLAAAHKDGSVRTDIWIDSPPSAVWKVLTATDDYPAWNPFITRLTGRLRAGDVIEFTDGSGADATVFRPTVLTVRPARELRWRGHVWVPGVFDGEHGFLLEAVGGRTHFVQSEKFTGLFVGRLTRGVLSDTAGRMRAMNAALKLRAEEGKANP